MSNTTYPKNICVTFGECEHEGDMEHYVEELSRAGASILNASLDGDNENCSIEMRIPSAEVMQAVKSTDAWDYA